MKSLLCSNCFCKNISVRIPLLSIFIASIFLTGCASTPTFIIPGFDQKQIKSIGIMHVVDKRNEVEDSISTKETLSNIEKLIADELLDKNYNVLTAGSVENILKEKSIENLTPENLCSELKVDGILYSELYEYEDQFFIHHSLKMNLKLFDSTGDSLWINDVDDSDRPFLSAVGASAGWAIGVTVGSKTSSGNKVLVILAGVAAAEAIYAIVDGIRNETSESINDVFKSLPEVKGSLK